MEEEKREVKFLTSLTFGVPDKDNVLRHVQCTLVQYLDNGEFAMFFDVVDPDKIKLADGVPSSDNT